MNFGSGGMGQVNFYESQDTKMAFPIPNSPMPFLPNQMPFHPNLNPNNAQMPILPETPKIDIKSEYVCKFSDPNLETFFKKSQFLPKISGQI